MTPHPTDLATARALQEKLGKPSNMCTSTCESCMKADAEQLDVLVTALQAQRERDAKVAEDNLVALEMPLIAGEVAAAIRAGEGA